MCLTPAKQHRIFDEHALACEAWLARNYGAEHRAVEELVPAPSWVSAGVVASPLPLPPRLSVVVAVAGAGVAPGTKD